MGFISRPDTGSHAVDNDDTVVITGKMKLLSTEMEAGELERDKVCKISKRDILIYTRDIRIKN